jgi:hydrogenase expression/formation protein HypD
VALLVSQFLVPPILRAICADPDAAPDAFLAAGHVCAIVGSDPYAPLARELHRPIAVTGFEPADILLGVLDVLRLFEAGRAEMINSYPRVVHPQGNPEAQRIMDAVFQVSDREWRGLGVVPMSGLSPAARLCRLRGRDEISCAPRPPKPPPACIAPPTKSCSASSAAPTALFRTRCTPDHPLGAPCLSRRPLRGFLPASPRLICGSFIRPSACFS